MPAERDPLSDPAFVLTPPEPGALVESLRAFGYTPRAAVADLVDNSIAAGARTVRIDAQWDGEHSWLRIADDGSGMDEHHLNDAMRLGTQGPLCSRDEDDLGRFGLGLKTASFSQCRHLSVLSGTAAGDLAVRRWDLDYVGGTKEWRLLTSSLPEQQTILVNHASETGAGTVVLWQYLDRLVGGALPDDQRARRRFHEMLREIEQHLGLVFHRFMTGHGKITLLLNGNPIQPWDPFLTGHSATQFLPEEFLYLGSEQISIQPYVLPHVSHFEHDQAGHLAAGGIRGWNAQQGFYVYRNRRLLVDGDWLGLPFKKEEHYKLARIQIDIPNTLDQEWDIDVRKSRARPPGQLKDDLRRIASVTRNRAVEVYRFRGKMLNKPRQSTHVDVWERKTRRGKVHYGLNREHPAILRLISVASEHHSAIEAVLRLVEETVPAPMITLDHSEHEERIGQPFEGLDGQVIVDAARPLFVTLLMEGLSPEEAGGRLAQVEPFTLYPELVRVLVEEAQG